MALARVAIQASAVAEIPWVESPHALISWWDVEKFSANEFCILCANLTSLVNLYAAQPNKPFVFQDKAELIGHLNAWSEKCREVGLEVAPLQIDAARDAVMQRDVSRPQISDMLVGLGQAITSEMSIHLFLWIPKEKSKYYEQDELFGPVTASAFPSAARDIKAAGSCYAESKNTASVMHLMRVLELGLTALANRLAVPIRKPDWENLINDIEAAIAKINGPHARPDWKKDREFYAGAAKDFRYFKNAWRNNVMHIHEHYDDLEAREILDHVKSFMAHLSKNGLKE
jgi:hypothetical protein